jgi:hypothetical protein
LDPEQLGRTRALRPLRESIAGSSFHHCFAIAVHVIAGFEGLPRLEIRDLGCAHEEKSDLSGQRPSRWQVLSDIALDTGSGRAVPTRFLESRVVCAVVAWLQESRRVEEMSCHEASACTTCRVMGNADVGKGKVYTRAKMVMVGALDFSKRSKRSTFKPLVSYVTASRFRDRDCSKCLLPTCTFTCSSPKTPRQ